MQAQRTQLNWCWVESFCFLSYIYIYIYIYTHRTSKVQKQGQRMLRVNPMSMTLSSVKPLLSLFLSPKPRTLFHSHNPKLIFLRRPTSCSVSTAATQIEPHYLSCSMPHQKGLKVAVLLSGGVDSSVALRLLHSAGHSCTAFYLKIWFQVRLFLSFSLFL